MSVPKTVRKYNEDSSLESQRETFVASISHDLKNPTIAQIRALELILKGSFGKIEPIQREIIEMVLDSCRYMNAMLASLLSTYKNEKGTIILDCEQISISDIASECIEEMIYLAKDKEITINFSVDAKEDYIYGDKIQIKRVIMNLLSNGIKYAYRKTILEVKVYNEQSCTCFSFTNNSPYIDSEKQKKIFARYVTFADSQCQIGIGLGLYASKKIVEAHCGNIFVVSSHDNKNTFGFKIPYAEPSKETTRTVTF